MPDVDLYGRKGVAVQILDGAGEHNCLAGLVGAHGQYVWRRQGLRRVGVVGTLHRALGARFVVIGQPFHGRFKEDIQKQWHLTGLGQLHKPHPRRTIFRMGQVVIGHRLLDRLDHVDGDRLDAGVLFHLDSCSLGWWPHLGRQIRYLPIPIWGRLDTAWSNASIADVAVHDQRRHPRAD